MIDRKEMFELLTQIMNNNLGNKLTIELASGILAMLDQHLKEIKNDDNA